MSEDDIEKLRAELNFYMGLKNQCITMDEAEKMALIIALQEIRDAVGLTGGDEVSPKQIVEAVRACLKKTTMLNEIENQLKQAQSKYDAFVKLYDKAVDEGLSSVYEQNSASYWKGRRDALRMIMPTGESESPDTRNGTKK